MCTSQTRQSHRVLALLGIYHNDNYLSVYTNIFQIDSMILLLRINEYYFSRKIKFFVADYLSLTRTAQMDKNCTFNVIKADQGVVFIGIAFPKGSPLKRKLDSGAAGLTNSGKKDRIFNFWFGSGKCKASIYFYPLELSHFKNLFIWASYGLLASFFILIFSLCLKCISKYREASQNAEAQ